MKYTLWFKGFNFSLVRFKLILLLLFVFMFNLSAKHKTYLMNSFAIYLGGGYPFVFDNFDETTNFGKYNANLGVGYILKLHNGFCFNAGVEYQNQVSMSTYNLSGTDFLVRDTQGKEMLYHYEFNSTYDYLSFHMINLPILLGYYNSGFYIGVGPKIGWCFNITEMSKVTYTTSSTYNQYIEDFVNMPNHYNATYTSECKDNLTPSLKLSAIFEIGYDLLIKLNPKCYHTLRFSLFGEYSLFNLKSNSDDFSLYRIDEENASQLKLSPFYYIKSTSGNMVVPFYSANVGLKLSWIINFPHRDCKNCNQWNRSPLFK